MKKLLKMAVLGMILGMIFIGVTEESKGKKAQEAIASNILRLHILANSDNEEDQNLKLAVRDKVVTMLRKEMKGAKNVKEAKAVVQSRISEIEKIAEAEMHGLGYDYSAKASLDTSYFPIKKYGDLTFPAGEYEALKVNIGKAEGKNWWCVMYPSLCFVDSTYQIVPKESKEEIKKSLTEEEYEVLLGGGKEDVKFGFKIMDWLAKLG